MFSNRDAREVRGLEAVFRSHEFGRATYAMEGGRVSDPARREDAVFAKEFGRPLTAVPSHVDEGEAEPRRSPGGGRPEAPRIEETDVSEQPLQFASSEGGAGLGAEHPEAAPSPPSKRRTARYWTIASVGTLAALVAAGITAGPGQHPRSNVSAQGKHDTARPGSGSPASGASSTGSTAPGGLLAAAARSGGQSPGTRTDGGAGSGNAPGGHVTLVGPATFTGTPVPPAASGSAPGEGSGTTGSPPPSGSTNLSAPGTSVVGSTVSAVGSSVTSAASQVGSSVPAAASATGVVNTVVNTLDQAVSASTG